MTTPRQGVAIIGGGIMGCDIAAIFAASSWAKVVKASGAAVD